MKAEGEREREGERGKVTQCQMMRYETNVIEMNIAR